jgi:GNAT superfamily N-acetyltransferase
MSDGAWRIGVLSSPLLDLAGDEDLPTISNMRLSEAWAENRWLIDAVQRWDGGRIFVVRPCTPVPAREAVDAGTAALQAVTSAVAYGDLGFIGNVIVHPTARKQGLGNRVMRAALDWLASTHVRWVELDATVYGRPLYERLGFKGTLPSWVLWASITDARLDHLAAFTTQHDVFSLEADDLPSVLSLDRAALGGDRSGLLRLVLATPDTSAYVVRDIGGAPMGYLFARPLDNGQPGLRIGPWVASAPSVAGALLAHAVSSVYPGARQKYPNAFHLHACIPGASQSALNLCEELGLTLIQDDLRMRLDLAPDAVGNGVSASTQLGSSAVYDSETQWVYAMLAPMVG